MPSSQAQHTAPRNKLKELTNTRNTTMPGVKDCTRDFVVEDEREHKDKKSKTPGVESDAHRIAQRQKQIDFGKNTIGYQQYITTVPRHERRRGNPQHPETPDIMMKCSKRGFDAMVKRWRKELHQWDLEEGEEAHKFVNCELRASADAKAARGDQSAEQHMEGMAAADRGQGLDACQAPAPSTTTAATHSSSSSLQSGKKRGLDQAYEVTSPPAQPRRGSPQWQPATHVPSSYAAAAVTAEAADLFDDWEDDIQL